MSYVGLDQNFFGRTKYLDLLKRRVIDLKEGYRQNVALLGNPYVGKSTLLHHFLINLDDEAVVPIYLDLENKDFKYLFYKFSGSLLYNFLKNQNLPLHDDFNLLLESTKQIIPHTVEVIQKLQQEFSKGKLTDCFVGLLTLPEIFSNETGKNCILILDEFQNLDELGVGDVFQHLGKKIMTQKKCFYVVTSSFPGLAQKILAEKLSLLFGNFEVIDVEAFDMQSSQKFIEYHLKEKRIGVQLRNFLTDFTGGYPLYLNLISREILNLSAIHNQNEVYMPLLAQAVENTLFDRWGVISRHFELIINELCGSKGNRVIAEILIALSNGKHKTDELVNDVGIKKAQMTQKLNRLLEVGVLVKNGMFYYFKDKLFKYWMKYVYQRRLKDVGFTPDKQQRQFKEEFNICIENFKVASRKDFSSRIVELLHCFDNESFDLNGRKYKLPLFREITPFKVMNDKGRNVDVIKAETNEAVWFIMMKKENFNEADVNTVLSEAKKTDKKSSRCVMISLTDMDKNTRVKALQERCWIWTEGELNTLLTLFDKPYIL